MDDILNDLLGTLQDILGRVFDGIFSIVYYFIFDVSASSFSDIGQTMIDTVSSHISFSHPSFDSVLFVIGFGFFIFILKHTITFVCDIIDIF